VPAEEKPRANIDNKTYIRHTPFSAPWVAARLKDAPQRAVSILRNWSHPRRFREINNVTIETINHLRDNQAIEALNDLKKPHVFIQGTKGRKLAVKLTVKTLDTNVEQQADALIDCGCEGSCIDSKYVAKHGLNVTKLSRTIPVFNADGSPNLDGSITGFVSLLVKIGDHSERIDFGVTNLGKGEVFLGHDWLKKHNPSIDWPAGTITFDHCPSSCGISTTSDRPTIDNRCFESRTDQTPVNLEDGDQLLIIDPTVAMEIRARTNISTELAAKENQKKEQKPWTEQVPEYLHDYPDVFTQEEFNELPPPRPWDHAIELLPGSEERLDCKIYPLSVDEQKQLNEFLEEHLWTGRIQQSKSPMASPFFFVKKKDGKLRPVQDYWKLNDMTIKN